MQWEKWHSDSCSIYHRWDLSLEYRCYDSFDHYVSCDDYHLHIDLYVTIRLYGHIQRDYRR